MKLKKNFGQNFLSSEKVVRDIIEAAELKRKDAVVEVGAGTGVLTKALAGRAKRVIAVEIDKDLVPTLKENLKDHSNVEIINTDILTLDPKTYTLATKIVGSIPYSITSPLIHLLVTINPIPKMAVFLVQKEVAEKISAKPPKATYLSNFVSPFYKTEIIRTVPPTAFEPQPKVESAILKLSRKPTTYHLSPTTYSKFLHHGFSQPRKMLNKRFKEEVLKEAGINPRRRAQTLTVKEWLRLWEVWKDGS